MDRRIDPGETQATIGTGLSRRAAALGAALVFICAACSLPSEVRPELTAPAFSSPIGTPDIKRANLDISYTALVSQDVHNVSSKKALESALEAVREVVRAIGGDDDVPTPMFQDVNEVVVSDFRRFADAVASLAAKNPQLSADVISSAAVHGMIKASPDCHTYSVVGGRRYDSRPARETGVEDPALPEGTVVQPPDEAQLQARMLDGGVAWIRFREFRVTGTYNIREKVKTLLQQALAAGAKAWLFDLRGNVGGNGPEAIASYFLNGESLMRVDVRTGRAGIRSAIKELRLPDEYQLPIAVIVNGRGGSALEVFSLFLKEAKRATIVGQRTVGCLGATSPTRNPDGSSISVAIEEYGGAITGTKYNSGGIDPDIPASDATAIEVASRHLREKIAGR